MRYVQKLRSPWKLQNAEKSASDTKVVNASKKLQLHMKLLFSCWELLAKFISSGANEARRAEEAKTQFYVFRIFQSFKNSLETLFGDDKTVGDDL